MWVYGGKNQVSTGNETSEWLYNLLQDKENERKRSRKRRRREGGRGEQDT